MLAVSLKYSLLLKVSCANPKEKWSYDGLSYRKKKKKHYATDGRTQEKDPLKLLMNSLANT